VIKLLRDSGAIILGKLDSLSVDYTLELIHLADRVRSGIVGKANMTEWANFRQVSHNQTRLVLFSSSQSDWHIPPCKTDRGPTRYHLSELTIEIDVFMAV
jgi:hypothetical protein